MDKRAFFRMAAGVAAVVAVFGSVSAGQWMAAALSRPVLPSATAAVLAADVPGEPLSGTAFATMPAPIPQPPRTGADQSPAELPKRDGSNMPDAEAAPVESAEELSFIVGVQDGFIAVFLDDGTSVSLKETTGIPILALPEEEQARLTHGIRVFTPAELARILEDYGS